MNPKLSIIKQLKNPAAGAVLFSSSIALVIACFIFPPKIIALF
tara:strand:+ start:22 stop:150 length:129 start_codon:yes stop_codon:yes gene_type:complete